MKVHWQSAIAGLTCVLIALHLVIRFGLHATGSFHGITIADAPLLAVLAVGGVPLVLELVVHLFNGEFGSDLLAGLSIVVSVLLGEYLAGALVVLMLSGGQALEAYAVRSASSVLDALARRMPSVAHRTHEGVLTEVALDDVAIGDSLVVFPHEICPVDGVVLDGHGVMDESYLTGEPYVMSKTPGAGVLSGAVNGESTLTIRAAKRAVDSRYARIMQVMRASEQQRPQLRRLGDQLGAWYTPLAVAIAGSVWWVSGSPLRFLAVLVVATPCPLLIAIPVAIIGSISLAARRGIIIKDPAILEKISTCRIAIFDKTGTLTYGQPRLTETLPAPGLTATQVLALMASLERYSKHPLARAVVDAATDAGVALREASEISEPAGSGLRGVIGGSRVEITNRATLLADHPGLSAKLPDVVSGMECVVLIDDDYAATCRFRDEARRDGAPFIAHLGRRHRFDRVLLVSGDRGSEVRYLAEQVGITEVFAGQSPEDKLALVRAETAKASTLFLGDGINDAPALTAATVGVAFGQHSDITSEAAGAIIMDTSLQTVDALFHIGGRLRSIALQSAVGGMGLSVIGMLFAAGGYLPPVAGAIAQEVIDVLAVANALRAAWPPKALSDY
jgi:heavy metal translocating P-type ATPase